MFTLILVAIFTFFIIATSTILIIMEMVKDRKTGQRSKAKRLLEIATLIMNAITATYTTGLNIIHGIICYELNNREFERYSEEMNQIGFMYFGLVFAFCLFSVLLTGISLCYKTKKSLYMSAGDLKENTNLCDYCAFNQLEIEQNTTEEDEIMRLLKENPDKINYVKKILK